MKDLSQFLEQFRKITNNSLFSQQQIIEVLKNHIKRDIPSNALKISKGILYINTDLFTKQAIFLKKQKIIKDINMFSKNTIQDIQ